MKHTIVIPAHDEEKRIAVTLEDYGKLFLEDLNQEMVQTEIIVVLNGCSDRTIDIVKEYETKYPIIRHLEFERSGKGFAVAEGFNAARNESDYVGFTDADNSTEAIEYYKLLIQLGMHDDGKCVGIIGSRWLEDSIVEPKQPLMRRFAGRCFNLLNRIMFNMPYKDTQCGAKIFTSAAAKSVISDLAVTEWAFDTNILYSIKRQGFTLIEHPVKWKDVKNSKLNIIKTPIRMFLSIWRVRLTYSPFRFIVTIYDRMPEWIKIHHRLK